ncbi:hypothetical protein K505DRAFT_2679 [Melanomma pulvis-pyrius CBS 109.77]|uniref:Uncharacterized protein n=1 Tax=Melanomma pulvis-pyrius CBS 109.77 TaxID=1314802 RepID=A0A6A6XIC0_9PLEO|nr:hypothetical protein K505DRAFT_2679 [Melanomma pulvis-pyrius CBS 109.77]
MLGRGVLVFWMGSVPESSPIPPGTFTLQPPQRLSTATEQIPRSCYRRRPRLSARRCFTQPTSTLLKLFGPVFRSGAGPAGMKWAACAFARLSHSPVRKASMPLVSSHAITVVATVGLWLSGLRVV